MKFEPLHHFPSLPETTDVVRIPALSIRPSNPYLTPR